MKFTRLIAVFCLLNAFFNQAFAIDVERNWKVMGTLANDQRRERLEETFGMKAAPITIQMGMFTYSKNKINVAELTQLFLVKGIHSYSLPNHGLAFSFDGTPDVYFCKEIISRSDQELTVLMPAFGSGRSIMDVMTLHPNAQIIANDIQEALKPDLKERLGYFGFNENNLTFMMGDIFEKFDELKNDSIDLVYVPNLVHFFSPFMIETFLKKLNPKLKKGAKVIIVWKGLSEHQPLALMSPYGLFEKNSNTLKEKNLPYPRYIEEADFIKIERIMYPYYAATVSDMTVHVKNSGYEIMESGEEQLVSASKNVDMFNRQVAFILGDYKSIPPQTNAGIFNNYVIISPANECLLSEEIEERDFFETRRRNLQDF